LLDRDGHPFVLVPLSIRCSEKMMPGRSVPPHRNPRRSPALIEVAPGVVYTTFHHPDTQANVITTCYSDWATNCPEYKVTAVQVSSSNGPPRWQEDHEKFSRQSRRIASVEAAE
jgi:hypothetical protein